MAVTLTKAGNKVKIENNDGSGWEVGSGAHIFFPPSISAINASQDIYITESLDLSRGYIKLRISDITGRPSDVPDEVADYLRTNFFPDSSGAGGGGSLSIDSNHFFADNAARDEYFDPTLPVGNPTDNTDELIANQTIISVGSGFQRWDGATDPTTYVNTNWTTVTAIVQGPAGATGATGPAGPAGPTGPAGEQLDQVIITSDVTINEAALSTYGDNEIVNRRTTLGNVTVTLSQISTFTTARFFLRFVNESSVGNLIVTPGGSDQFAQFSGSITLNRGESLEIEKPASGTFWNIISESTGASSAITPPITPPTVLPDGNVSLVGTWDPTSGSFPSGASQGNLYRITASGTVDSVDFFAGDFLLAIVSSPSTTVFASNWETIDGSGSVHSWAAMQGIITDQEIITTLERLGFTRNTGIVNPSIHELTITTVANRVDLNTTIDGSQTVQFSVTNHGDIASLSLQADPNTVNDFEDVASMTNPTIDGLQTQVVTISGVTTNTAKTISFRIRAIDSQGNVHISNEYDVEVRTLQTQERTHFGFVLSTEDQTNIVFANDDIEERDQTDGNWTVSGIPSDSNLYRIYWATPSSSSSIGRVTQSGFVLYNSAASTGNQFTEVAGVSIGGQSYNVLIMDAANAVNSNYNGSILTVS